MRTCLVSCGGRARALKCISKGSKRPGKGMKATTPVCKTKDEPRTNWDEHLAKRLYAPRRRGPTVGPRAEARGGASGRAGAAPRGAAPPAKSGGAANQARCGRCMRGGWGVIASPATGLSSLWQG